MSSEGEDPQSGSSHEARADPDDVVQHPEFAANDRADYQLTTGLFGELVGVRFRLLGFLPAVSGAILAVLNALDLAPVVVIGPVFVGLVVTWGLTLYEVRNSQIHDNAVHRARHLERLLGLSPSIPSDSPGGFFGERTKLQLFLAPLTSSPSSTTSEETTAGLAAIKHDSALAIVYAAVLASWAAVLAFNVVRFLDEHHDQLDNSSNVLAWRVSIAVALLVGLVGWRVVSALSRTGRNPGIVYRLAPLVQQVRLVQQVPDHQLSRLLHLRPHLVPRRLCMRVRRLRIHQSSHPQSGAQPVRLCPCHPALSPVDAHGPAR